MRTSRHTSTLRISVKPWQSSSRPNVRPFCWSEPRAYPTRRLRRSAALRWAPSRAECIAGARSSRSFSV
jgi:hypothetical protein